MAVSRALRNLLKLRELETEQHQAVLDTAVSELRALEMALHAARERERAARHATFRAGGVSELERRAFELQQTIEARRQRALKERYSAAHSRAEEARSSFVAKRVEHRQAEALLDAAEHREQRDAERQLQRVIDDWHAGRKKTP